MKMRSKRRRTHRVKSRRMGRLLIDTASQPVGFVSAFRRPLLVIRAAGKCLAVASSIETYPTAESLSFHPADGPAMCSLH